MHRSGGPHGGVQKSQRAWVLFNPVGSWRMSLGASPALPLTKFDSWTVLTMSSCWDHRRLHLLASFGVKLKRRFRHWGPGREGKYLVGGSSCPLKGKPRGIISAQCHPGDIALVDRKVGMGEMGSVRTVQGSVGLPCGVKSKKVTTIPLGDSSHPSPGLYS